MDSLHKIIGVDMEYSTEIMEENAADLLGTLSVQCGNNPRHLNRGRPSDGPA